MQISSCIVLPFASCTTKSITTALGLDFLAWTRDLRPGSPAESKSSIAGESELNRSMRMAAPTAFGVAVTKRFAGDEMGSVKLRLRVMVQNR